MIDIFKKSNKAYYSEADEFLNQFDAEHPGKSASQQKEIDKYQRVDELRDNPVRDNKKSRIWDGF